MPVSLITSYRSLSYTQARLAVGTLLVALFIFVLAAGCAQYERRVVTGSVEEYEKIDVVAWSPVEFESVKRCDDGTTEGRKLLFGGSPNRTEEGLAGTIGRVIGGIVRAVVGFI